MFSAAFYAMLIPISTFLAIISVGLMYMMNRWNLLRRSVVVYDFGHDLGITLINLLEFIIPLFGASTVVFYYLPLDPD